MYSKVSLQIFAEAAKLAYATPRRHYTEHKRVGGEPRTTAQPGRKAARKRKQKQQRKNKG